jgi:hypothetical protein
VTLALALARAKRVLSAELLRPSAAGGHMGATNIGEHRRQGMVTLERLDGLGAPAALKKVAAAFRVVHEQFDAACAAAEAAREARDKALAAVGDADDVLDASLEALAKAMVGAGANRKNPFAEVSKHSPSELASLAYAEEARAVMQLVRNATRNGAPDPVKRAAGTCERNARAVEVALQDLTRPQAAYARQLAARDALLPGWTKAFRTLQRHAAVAWDDDEATYKAVFAPPDAVVAPKKKRAKPEPKANGAGKTNGKAKGKSNAAGDETP